MLILLFSVNIFSYCLLSIIPKRLTKIINIFSLFSSFVLLSLTVYIWIYFDDINIGFQFVWWINWFNNFNILFIFGIDGFSIYFLLLTTFLFPFCILSSWHIYINKFLIINLLSIECLLILTFTTLDLFLFCLFFESLLIPIFFIILLWGTRKRRIKALLYFILYTLFGSIFLICALFIIYFELQTTHFYALELLSINKQQLIWILLFTAFAIKIPILPFHLWLPEAHVEAPIVGSVILAGLLLKLGGYGIIRFLFLFKYAIIYFQPFVILLCILSISFSSIIAIRQTDIKRIIAYSSIAHINFALLGYFSLNIYGLIGGLILIISHGIISTALFFLIGILYIRHHTRLLYYYSGLVQTIPLFTSFLFIFIISNFSFPLTSNFIGEILVLLGLSTDLQIIILIITTITTFFTVVYILLLFNRLVFGQIKFIFFKLFFDFTRIEYFIILILVIVNIIIGLIPITCIITFFISLKFVILFL
jgi:proton-translocating NADH-quinone oxidoreductase chain M